MLWNLLRLATAMVALRGGVDFIVAAQPYGDINDFLVALARPGFAQMRADLLNDGLLLGGALICLLAATLVYTFLYRKGSPRYL